MTPKSAKPAVLGKQDIFKNDDERDLFIAKYLYIAFRDVLAMYLAQP